MHRVSLKMFDSACHILRVLTSPLVKTKDIETCTLLCSGNICILIMPHTIEIL